MRESLEANFEMKVKRIGAMKIVENRLSLFTIIVMGMLLAGCGAASIDQVDPSLIGTWHGECEISLPVVFNPANLPDGVERTRQAVSMHITIREDAATEGSVGEATLEESVLKRNRGELGRRLNMASDYIIIDGDLSGPIVAGQDENDLKSFTIPFDLVDGEIRGGLMWRQGWKYPYPLCKVELERRQ